MSSPHFGPYSERRLESIEGYVDRVLAEVVDGCRRLPALESVLLGGSLGRGEGTLARMGDVDVLASDIEVYLVGRSARLRSAARRLERRFRDARLSVAWLRPTALRAGRAKNLSWRASRTIRLYEIGAASRLLWGSPPQIEPTDPRTLPLAEGVRLILNRFAEAAPEIAARSDDADRWLDKVLTACGDTLLLARSGYTASYRDRAGRLAELDEPWPMPAGWRETVLASYERKLRGGDGSAEPDHVVAIARATLAAATLSTTGVTLDPIEEFTPRFMRAASRNAAYLRYLPPAGSMSTYEAFILIARTWRAGIRPTSRMLVHAVFGHPLSLLLQGAAAPMFLGIATEDPRLVQLADDAMAWAGLPGARGSDLSEPVDSALRLRRHWAVAT